MSDFTMYAGDDKTLQFTVKDTSGDAVDITSATIDFKASRSHTKTASLTKQTGGSGISITDASGGVFTVTLTDSDTESLSGVYRWEAQVTFSGGNIATVAQGTMNVRTVLITAAT